MTVKCAFEDCEKSFSCLAKLKDHMNMHLGLKPYKCEICEKAFSAKKYLQAHTESHGKPVKCEKCGLEFTRKYKLKKHIELYCKKEYTCIYCGKVYKKKGCYQAHIEECVRRPKKMKETNILRKKPESRIVPCQICKAEFRGRRNMLMHVKAKHEKVRYACQKCEKVFVYNCSLRKHITKQHSEQIEESITKSQ